MGPDVVEGPDAGRMSSSVPDAADVEGGRTGTSVLPPARSRAPSVELPGNAVFLEWGIAVFIAGAVASAWRGAWNLLDAYAWPRQAVLSASLPLAGGIALFVLLVASKARLMEEVSRRVGRERWAVDTLYSYAGLWSCVAVWRGVWLLWDGAFGLWAPADAPLDPALVKGALASHAAGMFLLLGLGAVRSGNASPMRVAADDEYSFLGASATPGLTSFRGLGRLRRAPKIVAQALRRPAVNQSRGLKDPTPRRMRTPVFKGNGEFELRPGIEGAEVDRPLRPLSPRQMRTPVFPTNGTFELRPGANAEIPERTLTEPSPIRTRTPLCTRRGEFELQR